MSNPIDANIPVLTDVISAQDQPVEKAAAHAGATIAPDATPPLSPSVTSTPAPAIVAATVAPPAVMAKADIPAPPPVADSAPAPVTSPPPIPNFLTKQVAPAAAPAAGTSPFGWGKPVAPPSPAAAPEISASAVPAISQPTSLTATPTVSAPAVSEEEWQRLEQSVRENVLKQVLARVDFVLEHRVRDSLADVLQVAVEQLATDIRSGLHKTMEEVITRAVTQEIAKTKLPK
ncbi:hypothetical protein [Undibacterium terreum]|uniref:Uncharacterized protein n=1 Tax=Undibacterium terreum TaxID=1224302 RepID=A0A916XK29_9BURK|nr:hypothetical protein [Undibacterium terreum]GGC76371.1 hypothetical protein GCM10011396_24530 [Undibacterium terreum]